MASPEQIEKKHSFITLYKFQLVVILASSWTLLETLALIRDINTGAFPENSIYALLLYSHSYVLHLLLIFFMSFLLAYIMVFHFRHLFRNHPFWLNIGLKTLILIFGIVLLNFAAVIVQAFLVSNYRLKESLSLFYRIAFQIPWLASKIANGLIIFLVSQLIIQVTEKYSPGTFFDIFFGKYKNPRIENRIVMFIDMKDSTPAAEKLGSREYFRFIRDFINSISLVLLEHDAHIYQYVGDEIVVSWPYNEANKMKWLNAILATRKVLKKRTHHFKRVYDIIPEFRMGVHAGEVTIGEVGVLKKELVMSGDTMNTTARICTTCSELQKKYIISKEFLDLIKLHESQYESLGVIELKGKLNGMELLSLNI